MTGVPTIDSISTASTFEGCNNMGPDLNEFDGSGTVRTTLVRSTFPTSAITSLMSIAAIIETISCSPWNGIRGRMSLAGPGSKPTKTTSTESTKSSFELEEWRWRVRIMKREGTWWDQQSRERYKWMKHSIRRLSASPRYFDYVGEIFEKLSAFLFISWWHNYPPRSAGHVSTWRGRIQISSFENTLAYRANWAKWHRSPA